MSATSSSEAPSEDPSEEKRGDPGDGFKGHMGRTLAESMPHWRAPVQPPAASPNVIVILLDDLGYSDLGCYGGEINTPHLDRLASAGTRFTGYTTVPMCTPARAALLTGKNPHSVGCGWLTHNDPGYPGYRGEMSLDAPTMAELLRAQGYSTLAAGKWHNTYDHNAQPGGDMRSWPLQRGFDRFYGFLGAETSYFQPDRMMEGNEPTQVASYPADYFAPDDYTGRAVGWLAEQRASTPHKPFFLYLAFQTPHTPLQAKAADLARVRGRYDAGWDVLRRQRYERQCAMSLIEPNADYAPRNPGVPAWDTLTPEQQALYARHMEIYAALVGNADDNVGRLLQFLERSGQLDNTLIIVTSDNGANSVGGPEGVVNLQGRRSGLPEDPALVQRLLAQDQLGGADTYGAYPSGWTQVSNTPYRFYKRTPMAGGIRVPFIVHAPALLKEPGTLRRQWIHVTDVLPTVLQLTGATRPATFNGLRTRAMDGHSFAAMLADPQAPQQRQRQYYELQANRGYISCGGAGEKPGAVWKIVSLQAPRQPMQLNNWMLFNLAQDPAELNDLAAQHPDTLARLLAEFEADATANYVYPLDHRDDLRAITLPPHELAHAATARDFYPAAHWVPAAVVSPLVADCSYQLSVHFSWNPGDEGVLLAIGDRFCGISLFVDQGCLHFVYQWWYSPVELAPVPLQPGAQVFELDYRALGERKGLGQMRLNGQLVQADADLSPTMARIPSGGLTLGLNRRLAISTRYADRGVFRYTGAVERARIVPGPQAPGSPLVVDEAAVQAAMRANFQKSQQAAHQAGGGT